MPGTILGPDDSAAHCDIWRWMASECRDTHDPDASPGDECDTYDSCETCVADPACGFCVGGADCRPLEQPAGCDLTTTDDDCNVSICDEAVTCIDCLSIEGCVYCVNRENCLPLDDVGDCETVLDVRDGRCDPYICRAAESCSECTHLRGCAYCPESDECLPSMPMPCWDNVQDAQDCPLESCSDAEDCDTCWYAGCSWCDMLGGFCHDLRDGLCEALYDFPADGFSFACPPPNDCYSRESCEACLFGYGCGWCTDPIVVEPGEGRCLAAAGTSDYGFRCMEHLETNLCL